MAAKVKKQKKPKQAQSQAAEHGAVSVVDDDGESDSRPPLLRPSEILTSVLPLHVRPTLNSMFSMLEGGIPTAIDYLRRHSRHPEHGQQVALFVAAFDETSERMRVDFDMEHWAHEVGIDPSEIAGWVTMELYRFGRRMAQMIIEAHRPHLAAKGIQEALNNPDGNLLERFLESDGTLKPKQPTSLVKVSANSSSNSNAAAMAMNIEDAGLPEFYEDVGRVPTLTSSQQEVNGRRMLPESSARVLEMDFDVDDEEPEVATLANSQRRHTDE